MCAICATQILALFLHYVIAESMHTTMCVVCQNNNDSTPAMSAIRLVLHGRNTSHDTILDSVQLGNVHKSARGE